jgi:acyl-CoA synthetase (NDP forming)
MSGTTPPNPVVFPVSATAEEYAASIPELLADPGVDSLMVCYLDLSDDPDTVLAATSAAASGQPKPSVSKCFDRSNAATSQQGPRGACTRRRRNQRRGR